MVQAAITLIKSYVWVLGSGGKLTQYSIVLYLTGSKVNY
jgi:hypothetical protein